MRVLDDDASYVAASIGEVDGPARLPTIAERPHNRRVFVAGVFPLQCECDLVDVVAARIVLGQGIDLGPEGKGASDLDRATYPNERSGSFSQSSDVRMGSVGRSR